MTAREVYEAVMNGGSSDFAEAAAILDQSGRWRRIGGLAVNCYVGPVYTIDADIVVAAEDPEGRPSKRKKDELDLMRIAEAFPDLRDAMPREITSRLEEEAR